MQVLTRPRRHREQRVARHRPSVEPPRISELLFDQPRELFGFAGRPGGITVGPDGAVFVSGIESGSIWRVEPDGSSAPLVARNQADWSITPSGMAVTANGILMVADHHHHRICAVTRDQEIKVLTGGASGYRDGPAGQAMLRHPSDVAVGPDGTCYVADSGNDRIRAVSADGTVATLAGSIFDFGDGRSRHGRFRRPVAIDVSPSGIVYVADNGNNAVRQVSPNGDVTTLAGRPPGGDRNGHGRQVGLRGPSGVAVGPDGAVWVADRDNSAIRRISVTGDATTELRLTGRQWPTAVAVGGDGTVVAAVEVLDELFAPETRVLVIVDGRSSD